MHPQTVAKATGTWTWTDNEKTGADPSWKVISNTYSQQHCSEGLEQQTHGTSCPCGNTEGRWLGGAHLFSHQGDEAGDEDPGSDQQVGGGTHDARVAGGPQRLVLRHGVNAKLQSA